MYTGVTEHLLRESDASLDQFDESRENSEIEPPYPIKTSDSVETHKITPLLYLRTKHKLFLGLIGFYWPDGRDAFFTHILMHTYNSLVRLAFLMYVVEGFLMIYITSTRGVNGAWLAFGIVLLIQSGILIPNFFYNADRLNNLHLQRNDLQYYAECVRYALAMFIILTVLGYVIPITLTVVYFKENSISAAIMYSSLFLGILAASVTIAGNLFFILVDLKVSLQLVRQLIDKQNKKLITMVMFNAIRAEIESRVLAHRFATNSMLLMSLLDLTIGLIILLIYFKSFNPAVIVSLVLSFTKGLPYLVIVFFKSAEVNECSDLLTSLLGMVEWDENGLQEMMRVKLYINSQVRPISYPMVGMRLRVQTVMLQLGAWTVLFIAGVIRGIIVSSIE